MKRVIISIATCGIGAGLAFGLVDSSAVPGEVSLGTIANLYQPVRLDHALHVEITGDCASCHHQPFGEPEPCASCHDDPVKPSAFVHEMHWEVEDCTGCHHKPATSDLRCASCHAVEPAQGRLAVIGLKGAYHGLCLRCHGETGSAGCCGVCHPDR